MLQDIRENAQGTIAKIIIGVLILSFAVWGMDAVIGGFSGEPEVATVNGQDITEREFLRFVQLESQRRLNAMETPDPSLLDEDQIRRDVLDMLIQDAILSQDADSQGLALSDADIDALIVQSPQFQVDGVFNRDRFVSMVRNIGMGVMEFRDSMRRSYVINQIRAGIVQSALANRDSVQQLLQIQYQTRDFRTLRIPADAVASGIQVTNAEIEDYYQKHPNEFRLPEQVDAAYIVLSLDSVADSIRVSDEELQTYYEQRSQDLAREERRAAHILIEDNDKAEETLATIRSRLDAGEDFADLAREYSIDTATASQGGELGYAGRGVYDPEFEKALFALKPGEVSAPVKTPFGIHLIRLEDVRRSEVPPLQEIRDQLVRELQRERAREKFAELRTQLADAAYAADDLAGPAQELGLEVHEIEGITRDGGPAPFDHPGLVRQLFSDDVLNAGYNTELIDVGDDQAVVARVQAHRESQLRPLDDVRDDIQAQLQQQKTREALRARAEAILAELKQGQEPADMGEWQVYKGLSRNTQDLPPELVRTVFSLPRPDDDKAPTYGRVVTSGEAFIVALDAVHNGEVDEDSPEFQQMLTFLASLEGQREYTAYRQYLQAQAEIERP